jgi:N-acetylneuraminic acid mutarotase
MDGARNIALDGKLYLIGGAKWVQTGEDVWQAITYARVDVYDPQSDTWEVKANLPVPLGANGVCSMDGKFYVTGGGIDESNILNSFYSYDPETDSWEVLTEMPGPRIFHASVALDGKIYVIGGNDSENISALASVIVYDPDEDQWAPIASLPKRIFDPGACVLDGEIYVFGGSTRPDILGEAFKYNPEEDTWLTLEEFDPDRVKHSVVPIGRTVYIIGGIEYGDSVRNNVQAFELSDVCLDACIPDTIVEKNNMEIDLSMYFSHVDGGEIRYSVCCDQSDILDVSVTGSILTIERLRDGSGEIHVIAKSGEDKMGDVFQVEFITGVEDEICDSPEALRIFPNPSHGWATLAYSVRSPGWVRLEVFDILGKRIALPVDEHRTPGEFEYQLETGGLIPGIYLCNLTTADKRTMVKLLVEH